MKTSELTGAALDWAVAKAWQHVYSDKHLLEHMEGFQPSTDWSQGGPIIEREKIQTMYILKEKCWAAYVRFARLQTGSTLLIAAMRCYVASKLGDEVEIPVELTQGEKK